MLVRLVIITIISLCVTSCMLFPITDDSPFDPSCNGGMRLKPLPKSWLGMKRADVHAIIGKPVKSFESTAYNSGKKIFVEEYMSPARRLEEIPLVKDMWGNSESHLVDYCASDYFAYDHETDILVGHSMLVGRDWIRRKDSTDWYCNQCRNRTIFVH